MNQRQRTKEHMAMKIGPLVLDVLRLIGEFEQKHGLSIDENAFLRGALDGVAQNQVEQSVVDVVKAMPPAVRAMLTEVGGPGAVVVPMLKEARELGLSFGAFLDDVARKVTAEQQVAPDDATFNEAAKKRAAEAMSAAFAGMGVKVKP